MPCPTCDHTLESFEAPAPFRYYHCPRCGTSVIRDATGKLDDTVHVSKLVGRVRGLLATAKQHLADGHEDARGFLAVFHQRGVTEAVFKPEDRP